MINIYTIGFTQKTAEQFFTILKNAKIDCLVDVRLNNVSQLAGYTKSLDLKYFLKEILNIEYRHSTMLAPTKDILDGYKKGKISWNDYEIKYLDLISKRHVEKDFIKFLPKNSQNICLLCSEVRPDNCHRRLLAEYLKNKLPEEINNVCHL